ncbi:MAG TPA: hypothetical protein VGD69_16940 [Herpetosiphonaceae bacterium]
MCDQLSIERLVSDVWQHYAALEDVPFVVRPALPILFFGDSTAYARSRRKIITVGLNPSLHEFPAGAPFSRFVGGEGLGAAQPNAVDPQHYLVLLDRYFRIDAYKSWFSSFEPILNGLGASYYGGLAHTVLNTDLCSPLATDPTWSELDGSQQALLMRQGVPLWHRLVEYLAPDVMLISIARHLLKQIRFEIVTPWQPIYTIEQRKDGSVKRHAYTVEAATIRLGSGKLTRIVFGRAAHKPFGLISNADKVAIGATIGTELAEL